MNGLARRILLLSALLPARAERLPIRVYTVADGLADNSVYRMVRDSRGYLWFCTSGGLSRFDGSSFTSFHLQDGLPAERVLCLLESRSGEYWVGTASGLARWNPNRGAAGRFTVFAHPGGPRANHINDLAEAAGGRVLVATGAGLFRLTATAREPRFDRVLLPELDKTPEINALLRDRGGDLWAAGVAGLNRLRTSGAREWFGTKQGLPSFNVTALAQDGAGAIWVGTEQGLCRMGDTAGRAVVERCYHRETGGLGNYVQSILPRGDGTLWVATLDGPAVFEPKANHGAGRFIGYSRSAGFATANIESLAEDMEGHVWFGSGAGGGAMRLVQHGAIVYTEADGLDTSDVVGFAAGENGVVHVLTRKAGGFALHRFDGGRFHRLGWSLPGGVDSGGRGYDQVAVFDRAGAWWIASGNGVVRFAKGARRGKLFVPPAAQASNVFRLYRDSRGILWAGASSLGDNGLYLFRSTTGRLERVADRSSLPSLRYSPPTAFCEDRAGSLWFGLENGGWFRIRSGEREDFTSRLPALRDRVWTCVPDAEGRLWIGTNQGLVRVDGAETREPRFRLYSVAEGLSANSIRTVVAGEDGRLYLGTAHGIDEFDPSDGHVRVWNTNNGLPPATVQASFRDRQGRLWFGTPNGAFLVPPRTREPAASPAVFITGLNVQGKPRDVSGLGELHLSDLELPHDQNALDVSFAAICFRPGFAVRYQYRLSSSEEWSPLLSQSHVTLAGLAPGRYSFAVRAIAADGSASPVPATFTFRIVPVVWQRWWFQLLVAAAGAALIHTGHRIRLHRLLETERLRTRIASDLHDDIGSSLTHIAILSEVAARALNGGPHEIRKPLSDISNTARELIDSLSDIVWAIDPRKDRLSDLSQRMRRWASDLLTNRNIDLRFEAAEVDLPLDAEMRRELFLMFKEAIHNAARHSGCATVEVSLRSDANALRMEIRDDGCGFDPVNAPDGQGLLSLRRRTERLRGSLEVLSKPDGGGAAILIAAPLRGSRRP